MTRQPNPADQWTEFLRANRARAYRTARFYLRANRVESAEEPDDFVQDAYMRFIIAVEAAGAPVLDDPWSYLHTIMKHRAIEVARQRTSRRRTAEQVAAQEQAARSPWRQVMAHARWQELCDAVASVASEQHRAIFLRRVEGLTLREIGAAMGIPHTTVALRLKELPLALRAVLDEEGEP